MVYSRLNHYFSLTCIEQGKQEYEKCGDVIAWSRVPLTSFTTKTTLKNIFAAKCCRENRQGSADHHKFTFTSSQQNTCLASGILLAPIWQKIFAFVKYKELQRCILGNCNQIKQIKIMHLCSNGSLEKLLNKNCDFLFLCFRMLNCVTCSSLWIHCCRNRTVF